MSSVERLCRRALRTLWRQIRPHRHLRNAVRAPFSPSRGRSRGLYPHSLREVHSHNRRGEDHREGGAACPASSAAPVPGLRFTPGAPPAGCLLHPTPYTLHSTPYNRHSTPYTLRPTPYTLRPTPNTLRLTPYALHSEMGPSHCPHQVCAPLYRHLELCRTSTPVPQPLCCRLQGLRVTACRSLPSINTGGGHYREG